MLLGGIASALVLFGFAWWAPLLLLAAWGSTHWLLRESGVWRDRNTDEVQHRPAPHRLRLPPRRRARRRQGGARCSGCRRG